MRHPHPGRPIVCAHRGARAVAPENTLAAFARAADLGAEAIELDVQLSADGALVVCHDFTLGRTCNGRGRVDALPLAELKRLDFGAWFAPEFAGERIPTLDEVFDLAAGRLLVNIELKTISLTPGRLVEAVAALVARRNLYDQVMLSSFDPFALQPLHRLDPRIEIGLIVAREFPLAAAGWLRPWVRPHALHPEYHTVDARYVARARRRGCLVNVWTVNDEADMRRMLALGVDMIMSDVPDRLAAILKG